MNIQDTLRPYQEAVNLQAEQIRKLKQDARRLDHLLSLIANNSMYVVREDDVAIKFDDGWWFCDENGVLRPATSGRDAIDSDMERVKGA